MPNFVKNVIEFENKEKLNSFLDSIKKNTYKDFDPIFSFDWIIPMPSKKEDCDPKYLDTSNVMPLEDKEWLDWYNWNKDFWGTKWDAISARVDNNRIIFRTAWNTPMPIFKEMLKKFPDLNFKVLYADEEIGNHNCGILEFSKDYKGFKKISFEYEEDRESFGDKVWEIKDSSGE